jgi:DNA-binding NarL/FixJ family response regulator
MLRLSMPSDGLEVATARDGAEQAKRELKVAAAVPKPFDPDDLIATVRRVAAGNSRSHAN